MTRKLTFRKISIVLSATSRTLARSYRCTLADKYDNDVDSTASLVSSLMCGFRTTLDVLSCLEEQLQ